MRAQGTVKWFNTAYGFIEPKEDGPDLFVHSSQVTEMIDEGDTVEYEPDVGPKGPIATNVKLIKSAPKKDKTKKAKPRKKRKSTVDYNLMTVAELKGILLGRGLKVTGLKAELVSRLEENDKPKKKPKKKMNTKKGPRRSIIGGENFPLTVPITEISTEAKVAELVSHIDTSGPILVTCLKVDTLSKVTNTLSERRELVIEMVRNKFPDYSVELLDWPAIELKGARTTHPYITALSSAAVIVSSPDSDLRIGDFQIALVESVYQLIINQSKNRWVILGDETGSVWNEFNGKEIDPSGVLASMCWIVVPPYTNLPPLDQDFHGTGDIEGEAKAIGNLVDNESVICYTFTFEEGEIVGGVRGIGGDPHLAFWQDTLPLVLEDLSNRVTNPVKCDIFVEQVGALESGKGVIPPIITKLKTSLNNRGKWRNLSFQEMRVLSKNPCEHPWIGYPDALGHTIRDKPNKRTSKMVEDVNKIRQRTISAPYRQETLNGSIHQALMNTSDSLVFLKGLSSISVEDQWDYIRVFFSEAIREATSALRIHEWQELNKHMKESAGKEQGQKATQLIVENIDLESALEKMNKPKDRFELFMSMMGTANHMGDTESAFNVSDRIEELRSGGFEPGRDRLLTYHNLFAGTFDNVFDFDYSIDSLNQYLPPELEYEPIRVEREEDAHYLGSKIVALGLRNELGDMEQAIDISEVVRDYPSGDDAHLARHFIYLAELFMQQERNEDAFDVLRSRLEESCAFSRDENYSNGYYLASMLKASCLAGKGEEEFQYAKDFVIKRLKSDSGGAFPSQRIAYWFSIWAESLGLVDQASEAVTYLESMAEKQWKAENALGLIIACELLDLKHRGFTEIDAETYLENVLKNSHESTRKWVDAHQPSEEDWLAPLNFNYR